MKNARKMQGGVGGIGENWNSRMTNLLLLMLRSCHRTAGLHRGCFYRSPTPHSHQPGFFLAGLALQCFFELPVCKNTVLNQNPWQRHYQVLIRLKVVYHQLPERDIIPFLETMKETVAQTEKIKF